MQNFSFGQKSFVKFKQVRQNIQWNMIPKNMVQESQCWGEPILLLEAFRTWIPDLDNVRWQKRWAGAKDHLYEVLCINYNNKFQTRLLGGGYLGEVTWERFLEASINWFIVIKITVFNERWYGSQPSKNQIDEKKWGKFTAFASGWICFRIVL